MPISTEQGLAMGDAVAVGGTPFNPPPTPYSEPFFITNPNNAALTNYQVLLTVPFATGMQANFSDLRVFASDGVTAVPFWLESYVSGTSARVWVNAPSLPANGSTNFVLGYGNPAAAGGSSITATMVFGDDFTESALNTGNWTATTAGSAGLQRIQLDNPLVTQQPFVGSIVVSLNGPAQGDVQSAAFDGAGNMFLAQEGGTSGTNPGVVQLYTYTPGSTVPPVFSKVLTTTAPYHPAGMDIRPGTGTLLIAGGQSSASADGTQILEINASTGATIQTYNMTTGVDFETAGGLICNAGDGETFYIASFNANNSTTIPMTVQITQVSLNAATGGYTVLGTWMNTSAEPLLYSAPQGMAVYQGQLYIGVTDASQANVLIHSDYLSAITLNGDGSFTFGPPMAVPAEYEIEGMQVDPNGVFWCFTDGAVTRSFLNFTFSQPGLSITTAGYATGQTAYIESTETFGLGYALGFRGTVTGRYPAVQLCDNGGTLPGAPANQLGLGRVTGSNNNMYAVSTLNGGTQVRPGSVPLNNIQTYEIKRRPSGALVEYAQNGTDFATINTGIPQGALSIVLGSSTSTVANLEGGAVYSRGVFVRQLAAADPAASFGVAGSLTVASVSPVPQMAFSTPISGLTAGSSRSATSSDGTALTIDGGGNLNGTWALSTSGTFPTVTINETPPGGSLQTTVLHFAVAQLWTPAALNPASRVRFDTGASPATGTLSTVADTGTIGSPWYGSTGPTLAVDSGANGGIGATFNGSSNALNSATVLGAISESAPGLSFLVVFRPASASVTGNLVYSSVNGSGTTRTAVVLNANKVQSTSRATDAQSSANNIVGATTLASGGLYAAVVTQNLPAGSATVRVNGFQDVTGAITSGASFAATTSSYPRIGSGNSSSYFAGEILEVVQVQGVVSTAQEQYLEGYAAAQFSVPLTGPGGTSSGHPFASFPPTILGLSKAYATHGAAYSAQITGLPPSATAVSATSSDGTTLTVSTVGGVTSVNGTFPATSTPTVTLAATNAGGVALGGSVVVSVG